MLSIIMPSKRGIHLGWSHVAVAGSQKAKHAPAKIQTGKKFANVIKKISTRFTMVVFVR